MYKRTTRLSKNERDWIIIAAAWALAFLLIIFRANIPIPTPEGPSAQLISEPTTASSTVKKVQTKPTPKPKVPYEEILALYGSRRIQFNQSCQAQPSKQTFGNKTVIMLDNRSSERRTITVGSEKFTILPYDYTVVTLKSTKLPTTLHVSCGSQQNVAEINLQ